LLSATAAVFDTLRSDGGRRLGLGDSPASDGPLLALLSGSMVGILANQTVPPALPSISRAFEVSDARVGLVITAFYLASALAIPIVGVLADMYGRRPIIISSLGLFGVSGVGTVFVPDFTSLVVLRGVQGVAFAGITPITIAVVGDLYSGAEGSTAQGLRTSSHGISNVLAPAIGGLLAGIFWGYPFLVFALAFPSMGLVYLYLPETAPDRDGSGTAFSLRAVRRYVGAIRSELSSPSLSVLILGVATLYFIKTVLMTFIPLFVVRDFGVSPFVAGLLLSLRGAIRVVFSPLTGVVSERFGRNYSLYGSFGLVAVSVAIVTAAQGLGWVVVAIGVFSLGDATAVPLLNNTITNLVDGEQRAGIVSFMNTFKILANAAAPVAFGVVLSLAGYRTMFLTGVAVVLVYGTVLVVVLSE
jgi:MFS family permease